MWNNTERIYLNKNAIEKLIVLLKNKITKNNVTFTLFLTAFFLVDIYYKWCVVNTRDVSRIWSYTIGFYNREKMHLFSLKSAALQNFKYTQYLFMSFSSAMRTKIFL